MIYSLEDLIRAEEEGFLHVDDRMEFGPFSLDLRIGSVYKDKRTGPRNLNETAEMSSEEYKDRFLETVEIPEEGLVVESGEIYLWEPVEEIFLAPGLAGDIASRSSWARLGVRVDNTDPWLPRIYEEIREKPLCRLMTTGTKTRIREGDAVAQMIVDDYTSHPVDPLDMAYLVHEGELVIERNGQRKCADEVEYQDGGIVLTLDPEIFVYDGTGILSPSSDNEQYFEKMRLEPEGRLFPQDTFFISSSRESVSIPNRYSGYVTERHSIMTLQRLQEQGIRMPFMSHGNAPYIGPSSVFNGNITFENRVVLPSPIIPGEKQSELVLKRLRTPIGESRESRYNNQEAATLSRIEV